jgi:hypothetical protein
MRLIYEYGAFPYVDLQSLRNGSRRDTTPASGFATAETAVRRPAVAASKDAHLPSHPPLLQSRS